MEKIKAGIIGCGLRGRHFIRGPLSREPRIKVIAVQDIKPENVTEALKWAPKGVKKFSDYRDVLKLSDLDLAIIMTPDHTHEEMVVAAFKAGKHVFCEKPLALTPAGCKRCIQAGKKAGKKLVIGFVLRYAAMYVKTKALLDSGAIGKVVGAWVLHSVASGSQWYFHDWHAVKANTNGLLLQKGSHDFDIINWMVGGKPVRVAAFARRQAFGGDKPNDLTCPVCDIKETCPEANFEPASLTQCAFRKEIDVDDNHVVIIDYDNGAMVSYNECHSTPEDNRHYIWIGSEGKLEMNEREGHIRVRRRHTRKYDEYVGPWAEGGHGGGDEGLTQDLVKCVLEGGEPVAGADSGYWSIVVAEGAERAIASGKVEDLSKY